MELLELVKVVFWFIIAFLGLLLTMMITIVANVIYQIFFHKDKITEYPEDFNG